MAKWYGEEMLEEMTHKGWVVDHMNNNGFDCRISNLEFLSYHHNVAKGHTVDIEVEELRHHIALTICKDFSTGLYQIDIGCNDMISLLNTTTGESKLLAKLKFLYACDYRIVINDAEKILLNYAAEGKFQIDMLQCVDWKAEYPTILQITEEEKGRAFIERDGEYYAVIGNGVWYHSGGVDKGWLPPQ